jgi:hypothetical protein
MGAVAGPPAPDFLTSKSVDATIRKDEKIPEETPWREG